MENSTTSAIVKYWDYLFVGLAGVYENIMQIPSDFYLALSLPQMSEQMTGR
jgi:hypothetical protein